MKHPHIAKISIHINAPVSSVWNALIDPGIIRKYLHGTNAVSDWKQGSPLSFSGQWNGRDYLDKGMILEIEKEKTLSYSWLSSLSGLEDDEENYSIITYRLFPENGGTRLELTQANVASEESRQQSENNWMAVLNTMKGILES